MKLSVSLKDEDVAILDAYVERVGLRSRSSALQHAVRMLRLPDLEQDYSAAWDAWESSGEEALWSATTADGSDVAPR